MNCRAICLLGTLASACTIPNPDFDGPVKGVAEGESGGDGDGDGDATSTTSSSTTSASGDGDGDPSTTTTTTTTTVDGDGDGDPNTTTSGDGDGDACVDDQILCEGICVTPDTNEHCGSCEPCEGECVEGLCTKHHVMFLTTEYFPGSLGGIAGANTKCQTTANLGMVPPGDYIAWLAAEGYSAADMFGPGDYFFRPDGLPIAYGVDDLFDGTIENKIIVTEQNMFLGLGQECNPYTLVWTGMTATGALADNHCGNWEVFDASGGTGYSHSTTGSWVESLECNDGNDLCTATRKLYCVQL